MNRNEYPRRYCRALLVLVPALLTMAACSPMTPMAKSTDSNYAKAIESLRAEVAQLRSTATEQGESAAPRSGTRSRDESERFDVDSTDTPAKYFFEALVEYTTQNVVVHPDVTGTISLKLSDVTVTDVLNLAEEVYGFSYRVGPSGYVVYPASMQTRIFEIDYLDLQRSGTSRTRVSSGQVSENRQMGGMGGMAGMRGGNQMVGNFGQAPVAGMAGMGGMLEISGSNINTNYETDFWDELETTLTSLVAAESGSQVVVNSQAGVVMVRAMPQSLRAVEAYLETIEEVAQRQVVLEAKIIEVTLDDTFNAGINWIAVAENSDGDDFTFGKTAPPPGFSGNLDNLAGVPRDLSPEGVVDSLPITPQGGAFTMAFNVGDFAAFIELLELHGDTRVLSSPRVSTLNNQKAVIKAGTDEFFVTNVASNTVTGASSTTSRDVELTPFFSGIALDVTPQISEAGEVTLHIHPTVSQVTDQQKNLTVSGQTDVLPLAFSEIRESDSVVKARSGQIIVIGGLMRDSETRQRFGVPGLSQVPGVGNLFTSTRKVNRKTELVILLKPIVVQSDSDWTRLTNDTLMNSDVGAD
ncbi:MAG: pilus (MSHA type) biogenesis protein MshL [Pseudomonadota bacterium]